MISKILVMLRAMLVSCRKEGDNKLIDLELSLVNAEHALKSAEERHRAEVCSYFAEYVCLAVFSSSFAQVANLEGKIKQLEQELLDSRDGAEDKSLPVGKLQVQVKTLELLFFFHF